MVLSLFAKLKNKYFREFIELWGREPQTPKEWMTIQDNVVRELNKTKGVPILGYSKDDLEKIVVFNEITKKIAKKFWPGQLTIVLPLKDKKLKESMCVTDKIAVRVPDNKCILSLLKQCKLIIGTSANLSTKNSFVEPELCAKSITGYDIFLDGGTLESLGESTIIEIVNKEIKILRKGVISQEELFSLV